MIDPPDPSATELELLLMRMREAPVALPEALAGLAEQPGWPEVIADVRASFDRVVGEPPFVNQLVELDRAEERAINDLCSALC